MKADVEGIVSQLSIRPDERLLPVFEAIANSYDSLQLVDTPKRYIQVLFDIDDDNFVTDEKLENRKIKNITIIDNGVGFTDENMESFENAFKSIKSQTGAKGVGRFTWLKIFHHVTIDSVYEKDGYKYRRKLVFDVIGDGVHKEEPEEVQSDVPIITSVTLTEMLPPYNTKPVKSFQDITYDVVDHFIDLLDINQVELILCDTKKGEDHNINQIFRDEYLSTKVEMSFSIASQDFTLKHFKVNKTDHKHALILLAHNRKVTAEKLSRFFPELTKAIDDNGSKYYYLGLLSAEYFDKNVNATRREFCIPSKKDDTDYLLDVSLEEIFEQAKTEISQHLGSVLSAIRCNNFEKVANIIRNELPQYNHLIGAEKESLEKLNPDSISLENELHKIKVKYENGQMKIARELLDHIKAKGIDNEKCIEDIQNVASAITDANKSQLTEYVVFRKFILELVDKVLSKNDSKYQYEEVIHRIIFPMGKTSTEVHYTTHNLWLIDERLCYHKYLSSDKAISKESGKAPDLQVIFENTFAYSDVQPEEIHQSVVLVEFKRPMRNDYNEKENPITQTLNYIDILRSKGAQDNDGRPIHIIDATTFFCYVICDVTTTLEQLLDRNDFKKGIDHDGYYRYHEKYKAYIEIVSFSKLLRDAKKRNRVLFDSLGINYCITNSLKN